MSYNNGGISLLPLELRQSLRERTTITLFLIIRLLGLLPSVVDVVVDHTYCYI